jgi:hypothetical protein
MLSAAWERESCLIYLIRQKFDYRVQNFMVGKPRTVIPVQNSQAAFFQLCQ